MQLFSKTLATATLAATLLATAVQAYPTDPFRLTVGFADIFRVEGAISTVVLGNPNIADATPMDAGTVLLNGRAAGTTNMMVLDESGDIIADLMLHVSSRQPGTVTVRRGLDAQVYSCATGLCDGSQSQNGNETAPTASPVVASASQ